MSPFGGGRGRKSDELCCLEMKYKNNNFIKSDQPFTHVRHNITETEV
jgi:hypothetical protein